MVLAWKNRGRWLRPEHLLTWWLGPIFSKELRVASRRTRQYRLRFAYIVLLTIYMAAVWIPALEMAGGGAMSRAQMQVAANRITQGIVWFQFFGAQVAVLLLMSTAISEEVYGRTLGALMTAPLSSRQVVMNKFFSRLFQVLLLVALSLPILALVRVLGGIAWGYLLLSLSITAATVVFVGAVSLFFSALCRRAYVGVVVSTLIVAFLFVLVPIFTNSSGQTRRSWASRSIPQPFSVVNPYLLLRYCPNWPTAAPGRVVAGTQAVVTCCLLLLLAARLILAGAERLVGGLALRRAMGEPVLLDRLRHGRWRQRTADASSHGRHEGIRRVIGPPLIWKELTCTLSGRQKFMTRMILGIEVLLIGIAYLFPILIAVVPYELLHLACVLAFFGLGVLATTTTSATMISAEREAGTWPLLLLTPLTDRDILVGKVVGVLRRCGPLWLSLLAYLAAFAYSGCFHPLAVVQGALLVLSVVPFLVAIGFYCSGRFRRPTEAVTATFVLTGALWCLPLLVGVAAQYGMRGHWNGAESAAWTAVPVAQVFGLVVTTLVGWDGRVHCFRTYLGAPELTSVMLRSTVGYLCVSALGAWCAVRAFRRRLV